MTHTIALTACAGPACGLDAGGAVPPARRLRLRCDWTAATDRDLIEALCEAMAMPGRTDRPSSGSADRPGQGDLPGGAGPPRSPQDELRRRLANLPANHPSSPWYRERPSRPASRRPTESRPAESGTAGSGAADPRPAGRGPGQAAGARPGQRAEHVTPGRSRSDESGSARESPAGRARPGAAGGDVAAAARRAAPDTARRGPEGDRRGPDDALWQRAAAMQVASQARRETRAKGTPIVPRGKRDPYRPWFAGRGGDDGIWLSVDGAGDPWFAEGGFFGESR
jgi:hypothetical protein